jgi:hypothetical protein
MVALAMLDLRAAFYTIDHPTLLSRLKYNFGICDKALQWIKSYLEDRVQSVIINRILSTPAKMNYAVKICRATSYRVPYKYQIW